MSSTAASLRPIPVEPTMIDGMSLQASIEIAVPPVRVYDAVRRLERMGEWSPENRGGTWLSGDGSAAGDLFEGVNGIGDRTWTAKALVTRAEPGVTYSFSVPDDDDPVARWSYSFEPAAGGTRVTESWEMHRPPPNLADAPYEKLVERREAIRASIRHTLDALKVALESE